MKRLTSYRAWKLGAASAALLAVMFFAMERGRTDHAAITTFPALGLTPNETARLNVTNTKFVNESNVMPCSVRLRILNSVGHVLTEETRLLRPGQVASLDVAGPEAVAGVAGLRTQVWAAVASSNPGVCPIIASFELIDNATSRTLVALGQFDAGHHSLDVSR